jgi:hypothetical protein
MSSIAKVGRHVESISQRYVAFFPCLQAAPDDLTKVLDRSGKGNHAVAAASGIGGNAWANAQAFTSATAATTGAVLSKAAAAAWTWNPSNRDTLIFSCQVYTPNTVASDTIFRTGTAASTGGWWLETNSTGFTGSAPGVRAKFYDLVNGTQQSLGYAALPANTWASLCLILDGPGNQAYMFVNGELAAVSANTNPRSMNSGSGGTSVNEMTVQQAAAADIYLGGSPSGATDVKRLRALHFAVVPASAGAIADPYALVMRLHRSPFNALAATELP